MNLRTRFAFAFVAGVLALGGAGSASAHEDEAPKNLKVLAANKEFEGAMKGLSKGLGVKCNACHVKGEFDSDKMAEKIEARKFFEVVVGEKDAAKRDGALAPLLAALKLKELKNKDEFWKGVDQLKKK